MEDLSFFSKTHHYKDFESLFDGPIRITLPKDVRKRISDSHQRLTQVLKSGKTIYGVNTGFGQLSQISIPADQLNELQTNLVRSHAAGVGKPISPGLVRIILYLKLLSYSKGYSGIRLELASRIKEYLNHDLLPIIPEKGSVGASGDLAPLGHMALALIGEGEVTFKGKRTKTSTALKKTELSTFQLEVKEGLSLINGTQFSTAIGIQAMNQGDILAKTADLVGAISVEASLSSRNVFKSAIHKIKHHPGQKLSAKNVWNLLKGSDIVKSHSQCDKVQDPYSFRCIPHVHGASRDTLSAAGKIINQEINSVSDNPLVMANGDVISSGHFHGESVAQALDMVAISMSELGAISERRTHYFMKGVDGVIPPFMAKNPGLESGYMIAHVTASALASENKTLSHPASVDSLPTSGGQEDQVSMAPWAGQKALQIQENVATILAVELMVALTAIKNVHSELKPSRITETILSSFESDLKLSDGDRSLNHEIELVKNRILNGELITIVHPLIELE